MTEQHEPTVQYLDPPTRPRQIYISTEMWDWLRDNYPTASAGVRALVVAAMKEQEEEGNRP